MMYCVSWLQEACIDQHYCLYAVLYNKMYPTGQAVSIDVMELFAYASSGRCGHGIGVATKRVHDVYNWRNGGTDE
jgi:hypothetical protein